VFGGAAKLAYYFLLALFSLLIFLTSAIGFLPGVQGSLLSGLAKVAPPEAGRRLASERARRLMKSTLLRGGFCERACEQLCVFPIQLEVGC
jgi:uncharacterized BrkB/YihY/UPF0761 family membrane protein